LPGRNTSTIIPDAEYQATVNGMAKPSIAMLDKDHHIHMVPADRVLMMSIEHSAVKKVESEKFEIECFIKLSVEGFPHPLEDAIRFTFAAARIPSQDMMTEITFVQNHIIKYVFDLGLTGELCECIPDDPSSSECGITISSEIKNQMLASNQLKEVMERYGALPETLVFVR
jgi:hypothetical protein